MVRKSERNKSKGNQDKSPEKVRKAGRVSRRRKKSSSESEPEPEIPVEEPKETEEPSSENQEKQKPEIGSPKSEQKDTDASSSVANRPKRRKQAAESEPAKPQSTDRDWKEDEAFWNEGEPVVETSEAKPKEEGGTLWKVQSANGSSGEIQKLKICRQKPVDVSESSPSPAKDSSPCRKKSARSSHSESSSKETTMASDCEASRSSSIVEAETPSSTVPDQSEPVPADSTNNAQAETQVAQSESKHESESVPEVSTEEGKEDIPTQSDEQTPTTEEKQVLVDEKKEEKVEETPNSTEDIPAESMQEVSRSSPEKEAPDSSTRRKQDEFDSDSSDSSSNSDSSSGRRRGRIRNRGRKCRRLSRSNGAGDKNSDITPTVVDTIVEETKETKDEETKEKCVENVEKETKEAAPSPETAPSPEAAQSPEAAPSPEVSSEQEPPTSEEKASSVVEASQDNKVDSVKESESSEPKNDEEEASPLENNTDSTSEAVKEKNKECKNKITDTSIEVCTDSSSIKVGDAESSESATKINEPKSLKSEGIEEGELSPVNNNKEQKDTATNQKKEAVLINRSQSESSSKPTILKRVPVEAPPVQRKRRAISKSKPAAKEPSLAISSTSLKLIVPEAKPLPLEEVDLSVEEVKALKEQPKPKRVVNLTKSRDLEVKVKNEVQEEKVKKEPIIVEKKPVREEKPPPKEDPPQPPAENHKVIRKISIVSDDAKKLARSPSPPAKKVTSVLFITNLVRPFTAPQLRELLARTGSIAPNGFYIDKIKSKCYVKYTEVDMAVETRHALHGVRWPVNNPKTLKVEFATSEDMALVQELAENDTKKSDSVETGWLNEQAALKPARRVTAGVREWDVGKVAGADGVLPQAKEEPVDARKKIGENEWTRNKERGVQEQDNRRRERPHSPETKEFPARKVKRRDNDAPSKLLDDLFRKTKTTPCIYWLPLTAAQIVVKEEMRRQHMAEHERRLAEIRKSEQSRRERERERRKK